MQRIPDWVKSTEFSYLDFVFHKKPSFQSSRVFVAKERSTQNLVIVKYMGRLLMSDSEAHRELVNTSVLKAAEIKARHMAFDNLLSIKWTEFGLVLVKQYLPNTRSLNKIKKIDLDSLVLLLIQVCDALRHIHKHGSSHNDVTSSNIIVNNRAEVFLVDYDLAFPIRDFFRSSYLRNCTSLPPLEKRQVDDVEALEAVTLSSLRDRFHSQGVKGQKSSYTRMKQAERALARTVAARSSQERLSALLKKLQSI